MSPIDDELRGALHGRAQVVTPGPDPLAGIERRARRIRRNRVTASVAGSALAVAAIAAVVPALQTATSSAPREAPFATTPPSAEPTSLPRPSDYGLDPDRPWAFRGTPLDEGSRATIEREYAVRYPGAGVTLTPLFAQVYEPSQSLEVVFLAKVDGDHRWGVAQSSEAGPEFVWDVELPDGATSLAAALPGDEGVARLLVVAGPDADTLEYGPNDATEYVPLAPLAPGVGTVALDGDPDSDSYRVGYDGSFIVSAAPALPPAAPTTEPDGAAGPGMPDNVLDWGFRGQEDPELESRAVEAYAQAKDVAPADVGFIVLFSGDNDPGQRFTVLQVWTRDQPAQVLGFVDHPDRADELVLQPLTDPGEPVVALLLTQTPGRTFDELVVIPTPRTGQVLYAENGRAEPRPVEPAPGLDGVVLIERERGADGDRLTVLDGNGDLDRPLYDGTVAALLCAETGCS